MNKRTAEILEINAEFTVILHDGQREVRRYNHFSTRKDAEFHANRWVKEGRYLIDCGNGQFKPKVCADKKCRKTFVPKKEHAKYCSKRCGDRVRHERAYKPRAG